MKNKLFSLVLSLCLLLSLSVLAFAENGEFILDFEDKVSDEAPLELKAQEIYDAYGIAVVYIRSTSLEGMTGAEYAQYMYAQHVSYPDAVVLVDCAEASSYYMHYAGSSENVFQSGDGAAMMAAFDEAGTYDEGVRDYLITAERILVNRNVSRDLVLLAEDNSVLSDAAQQPSTSDEAPLLTLNDPQPVTQPQTETEDSTPLIPEERQLPLVVDTAGVIDPDTVQALNTKAASISEKYKCEVAAAFVKTTGTVSPQAFADDFYDYNGYGYGSGDDGIILVIAVDDRSFAVSTYGSAGYTFTDYGQVYMDEKYIPFLRNNDWSGAADAYLDVCAELLEYELVNGIAYDIGHEETESSILSGVVFSLIVGFVLAFIPIGAMKRKMFNVQEVHDAADYLRQDSFELKRRYDRYITSTVTKTPIPKDNDNNRGGGGGGSSFHVSSSGRSHGGHSGRF